MTIFFTYPQTCFVGRNIPKNKLYEKGDVPAPIKKLFVEQIDSIQWSYKLSPETMNIGDGDVQEIQIFTITLKNRDISTEILTCIDQIIPSPVIFEVVTHLSEYALFATYKQLKGEDMKVSIGRYFSTPWQYQPQRRDMPFMATMTQLYLHFISGIVRHPVHSFEALEAYVHRAFQLDDLHRQIEALQKKLSQEKQMPRKVDINRQIRELTYKVEKLKAC